MTARDHARLITEALMEPVARNDLKRYMDVREVSTYLGLSKWMIYNVIGKYGGAVRILVIIED